MRIFYGIRHYCGRLLGTPAFVAGTGAPCNPSADTACSVHTVIRSIQVVDLKNCNGGALKVNDVVAQTSEKIAVLRSLLTRHRGGIRD